MRIIIPSSSRVAAAGLVWYHQDMFEEAESEALRALGIFEKLGATNDVEEIDGRSIKQTWNPVVPGPTVHGPIRNGGRR